MNNDPTKPENVYKKIIWRNSLSMSETMESATTWSLAGIGAIIALFLSNLDSVGSLVTNEGIKVSLLLFTGSLIAGAISKHVGMAVTKGLQLLNKVEGFLTSEPGQQLMGMMKEDPKVITKEVSVPYFWPLSQNIRKQSEKGMKDCLHADKQFVRMFCFQLILIYIHWSFAAAGIVAVSLYLK